MTTPIQTGLIPNPYNPAEPGGSIGPGVEHIIGGTEQVLNAAKTTAQDTAAVLHFLSNPVRVGELVIGIILITVGINAMLKSSGSSAQVPTVNSVYKQARRPPANPMIAEGADKSALSKIAKTGIEVAK